jgi:hypothetical protein
MLVPQSPPDDSRRQHDERREVVVLWMKAYVGWLLRGVERLEDLVAAMLEPALEGFLQPHSLQYMRTPEVRNRQWSRHVTLSICTTSPCRSDKG